jgi:hypothetical protein
MDKAIAENFFDVEYSKESMALVKKHRLDLGLPRFNEFMVNSVANFPLTTCVQEVTEVSQQERPTLIVWAYYDTTTPGDECFKQWHDLFSQNHQADFAVIKDTRHNFFNEEREIACKLVLSWLKGDDHKLLKLHELRNKNSEKVSLTEKDKKYKEFWDSHLEYQQYMI